MYVNTGKSVWNDTRYRDHNMESPRVLVADDQPHVLEALRLLLKTEGFTPETVNSPAGVLQAIRNRAFDVLLLDLNYARDTTSGNEGLELLSRIREFDSALPVVLMTAWANIELAVEAMQKGGRDFMTKPWDNQKLLKSLRRQIEEGRVLRQQQREIDEARVIQERLLPVDLPASSGCDVQIFWKPAKDVGGDYFDAIPVGSSAAAFCIGDVAGKGLPAALLMSNMQASVRVLAAGTSSPAALCRGLNRMVLKNTRSERLTTFFCGILDSERENLRYSNAGHIPPFLVREDGEIRRLEEGGMLFGIGPDSKYEEGETAFRAGDRLILLTDGITEAMNAESEDFGENRISTLLRENRQLRPADLQQKLLEAVRSFAAGEFCDDATFATIALNKH